MIWASCEDPLGYICYRKSICLVEWQGSFFLNNLKIYIGLVINSQYVNIYIWRIICSEATSWVQRDCCFYRRTFV